MNQTLIDSLKLHNGMAYAAWNNCAVIMADAADNTLSLIEA
jgi:hypothetical protein